MPALRYAFMPVWLPYSDISKTVAILSLPNPNHNTNTNPNPNLNPTENLTVLMRKLTTNTAA